MANLIGPRGLLCAAIAVVWALGAQAAPPKPMRLVADVSPPYEDLGNEKAPGFSVEVIRQVFAAMGQTVSFEAFPNTRSWMMVARGEADGVFSGPRTSEREGICLFPDEPLVRDRWFFFVRTADSGKLKFSSFNDLVGHRIAVPGMMTGLLKQPIVPLDLWKFLREHGNRIESAGGPQAFQMLAAGHVDYAIMNLRDGMLDIAKAGLAGKITPLLARSVMDNGQYVCFSRARVSPSFVAAFSHALQQFKQTPAFQTIQHKYLQ